MTRKILSSLFLLVVLGLSSCGSENNSFRITAGNQQRDVQILQGGCDAALSSTAIPIDCFFQFRFDGQSADSFSFTVDNPDQVSQFLNTAFDVTQSDAISNIVLTIDGQSFGPRDGQMTFFQMTNIVGGRVAGQVSLLLGPFVIEGTFNTEVVGEHR